MSNAWAAAMDYWPLARLPKRYSCSLIRTKRASSRLLGSSGEKDHHTSYEQHCLGMWVSPAARTTVSPTSMPFVMSVERSVNSALPFVADAHCSEGRPDTKCNWGTVFKSVESILNRNVIGPKRGIREKYFNESHD